MKKILQNTFLLILFCTSVSVYSSTGDILTSRNQVNVINTIIEDRLDNLLPDLMKEAGINMWLVINREYAEDRLYFSLVPQPSFAARRTTMLIFLYNEEKHKVERYSISKYPLTNFYENIGKQPSLDEQWQLLVKFIETKAPENIALNYSKHLALADGLTHGLYQKLQQELPEQLTRKLISAEPLIIRWQETRSEKELAIYPHIVALARNVISEAFSNKVISPGITTTDDVSWYIRERFEALNLRPWFQPYVTNQKQSDKNTLEMGSYGRSHRVIEQGDILHTDVGICYLNLCTDTQEMGYVLKVNERKVPQGLVNAMAEGNRWQDLVTGEFKIGRTGNIILKKAQNASKKEGIKASLYSHPIGFVGHAAGPAIGMWDNQNHVDISGDRKLNPNTAYAIEGNIKYLYEGWDNQPIQIYLEQTAIFNGKEVIYLGDRQTQWHIVTP